MVALAGIDPIRFLDEEDPLRVSVTVAVASRTIELRHVLARNQAVLTANAIGKMLGG